jgi:hypothetical protein
MRRRCRRLPERCQATSVLSHRDARIRVPMYYRAMTPGQDGSPSVGRSARRLGVRVPGDIAPDASGRVAPGAGGMSVAPDSQWNLPNHRRPRRLGRGSTGPDEDRVFSILPQPLQNRGLVARPDPVAPAIHAFVEPAEVVQLPVFESSLVATRPDWIAETEPA